jgi:hypothetical protein
MDEAPCFDDEGSAKGLGGKIAWRLSLVAAGLRLAIGRRKRCDALFGASHEVAQHAIEDFSRGSGVEKIPRRAVVQRAHDERRCVPDALQVLFHFRSGGLLDGDTAINRQARRPVLQSFHEPWRRVIACDLARYIREAWRGRAFLVLRRSFLLDRLNGY